MLRWQRTSPPFSPVVVAKRRRRRQDKARAGRATEAYLTVRRGARPSATQYWRMDPALQQTTGEKCGLEVDVRLLGVNGTKAFSSSVAPDSSNRSRIFIKDAVAEIEHRTETFLDEGCE